MTTNNGNIMKKTCHLLAACLMAALLGLAATSCGESDPVIPTTSVTFTIEKPADVTGLTVKSEKLVLHDQATGEQSEVDLSQGSNVSVAEGLYDVVYTAEVEYQNTTDDGSVTQQGTLSGRKDNVEITGQDTGSITIETYLSVESDDFIFEEVFFAGTLRPSGSQYYGDSYIKIYNNTDHVLYADGLAFGETQFGSTQVFDYTPDIRMDTCTVWSFYVIPGSGTDHPVQPGESLLIVDTGIDHRLANTNSLDLSAADFEWYDESTKPNFMDIDSPTVPNLDKWYCYTESFYVLHNRGFKSFILARLPKGMTKEQWLRDAYYVYSYTMYLDAGTFYMTHTGYKVPNSWIVDGVNCSVEAKRVWNVLPPKIDAGWTHDGYVDKWKDRYFKSIRRKMQYLNADGTRHLQDTNNSTADFNTEVVASEIEIQGTSMDAAGTKCTQKTYDGVQPRN